MPTPLEQQNQNPKKDPNAKIHQSMVTNNLMAFLMNRYILEKQLRGEDTNKSKQNRKFWINGMVEDGFITHEQGEALLRMHGDM